MKGNLYSMNTTEVGKYAKDFFVDKLETLGADLIHYGSEDTYIHAKLDNKFYKFKVKSARKPNTGYIKIKKKSVDIKDDKLFIVIIFFYKDERSKIFLIPVADLANENGLFRNRDYVDGKSTSEWGLNITNKNMNILNKYELSKMLGKII